MSYYLLTILFGILFQFTMARNDSILSPRFSNFLEYEELRYENSLLDSIVKSFEEQGRLFCIVMIYDEIGVKSNLVSTCKSKIFSSLLKPENVYTYVFATQNKAEHAVQSNTASKGCITLLINADQC